MKEIRELIFGGNWAGLFDKLDENGDGTLSLGEFMAQDEVRNSGGLMAALTAFEVSNLNNFDSKFLRTHKNFPTLSTTMSYRTCYMENIECHMVHVILSKPYRLVHIISSKIFLGSRYKQGWQDFQRRILNPYGQARSKIIPFHFY